MKNTKKNFLNLQGSRGFSQKKIMIVLIGLLVLSMTACEETKDDNVQIANPASTFCIENGGTLDIKDGDDGQYGVCTISNGQECEEWAYFRGECPTEPEEINLETCKSYFDGCNICTVENGIIGACTEKFCEEMEEPTCLESNGLISLNELCHLIEGTKWVPDFNECEYIGKGECELINGTFFECGSACRNDPLAEMCTTDCVPYCTK